MALPPGDQNKPAAASTPARAPATAVTLDAEQRKNAKTIIDTGRRLGMSERDITIALMTAMQESSLHNLSGGSGDSVGLFQQRPSWGSAAQRHDPLYSSTKFYTSLKQVKDRDSMSPGQAAQAVQRSAYPAAYAKHETVANTLLRGNQAAPAGSTRSTGPSGGVAGSAQGWVVLGGKRYPITQTFGNPSTRYKSGKHSGVDIGVPIGTRIYADIGGTVVEAGNKGAWGNTVMIQAADGTRHRYGHLSAISVKKGDQVNSGLQVGLSGKSGQATGPHLHYEVYNAKGASVDPMSYLQGTVPGTVYTSTGAVAPGGNESIVSTSEVEKKSAADYGYVDSFLKGHPDVKAFVDQAADEGWTKERLDAMVRTTDWWRKRTDAQRKYDVLGAEDPKELERQVALKFQDMRRIANNLGVNVGTKDLQATARQAIRDGWSDNEVSLNLSHRFNLPVQGGQVGTVVGQAGITVSAIGQLATDFGVPLGNADLQKYTQQVLGGQMTVDGLTDNFRDQAKVLYPSIAKTLEAGLTTQQVAAPYLTIAQRELGVTDQQMNLADSKWTVPFDDGTGKQMTADQWTKTLRNDGRYGWDRSTAARTMAANSVMQLGRLFGRIG